MSHSKTNERFADEHGIEHAPCFFCGADCSTHDDAGNPLAPCGDCGNVTCSDHRVNDEADRCVECASVFYAAPTTPHTDTRDDWRQHFTKNAADLLQIQRAFAGEEVFKRLLRACFMKRRRASGFKINERTVLTVLQADTEEIKNA